MSDKENESESAIDDEEPGNGHSTPLPTSFSMKPSTVAAAHITACACGTCEVCQLRAFILAHGEKLGWKRLPNSVCSAVVTGEPYWQLFAVTHDVSVLRQVKAATLEAEQEAMAPPEGAWTTSVPELREDPSAQATDLWT